MCRVEKHCVPVCFYLFQPPVFYSLKSGRLLHITTLLLFILKWLQSAINFIVCFWGLLFFLFLPSFSLLLTILMINFVCVVSPIVTV